MLIGAYTATQNPCGKRSDKKQLRRRIYSREKWHDLAGQFLCSPESLRIEHDLSDQLTVRRRHRKTSEQLLQIIGQVWTASVAWVHRDEDSHVRIHTNLLPNQLDSNHWSCKTTIHTSTTQVTSANDNIYCFLISKKHSISNLTLAGHCQQNRHSTNCNVSSQRKSARTKKLISNIPRHLCQDTDDLPCEMGYNIFILYLICFMLFKSGFTGGQLQCDYILRTAGTLKIEWK